MLNEQPNDDEWSAELKMDIRGVRMLSNLLGFAREVWPGSPARPAEEQEFIMYLQEIMNRLTLEYNFENLELSNGREET